MKLRISRMFMAFLLASGIQLSLTTCTKSGEIDSYNSGLSCEEVADEFVLKR